MRGFVAPRALLGLCLSSCAPLETEARPPEALPRSSVELQLLPVEGHNPAIVSVPPDDGRPRPLLVATHGAWDRAEPHCELWQALLGERAFILCPAGQRTDNRVPHEHAAYYYPDHYALDEEVRAAVTALERRFQTRLDATRAVYTGFSQGAIHGARVIANRAAQFPRAALVEGGNGFFDEWSAHAARRYRAGGGERVLFGCGSPACVRTAERCAGYLLAAEVSAEVVHAEGAGHSYGGAMQDALAASFDWLVEGDERWTEKTKPGQGGSK